MRNRPVFLQHSSGAPSPWGVGGRLGVLGRLLYSACIYRPKCPSFRRFFNNAQPPASRRRKEIEDGGEPRLEGTQEHCGGRSPGQAHHCRAVSLSLSWEQRVSEGRPACSLSTSPDRTARANRGCEPGERKTAGAGEKGG